MQLALSKSDLQEHFKVAYEYSGKWQVDFSPTKCVVMVFRRDTAPHMNIMLGRHKVKGFIHEQLGVCLAIELKG